MSLLSDAAVDTQLSSLRSLLRDRVWPDPRQPLADAVNAEQRALGLRPPKADLRAAAVLILLVKRDQQLNILLTQRTDHLRSHAGQVSFAGGGLEAEDADATAAALRETTEEIGLMAAHIDVLGPMDLYVTGTGYAIAPIIGLAQAPLALSLDEHEVADVFEVPLSFLLDMDNYQPEYFDYEGKQLTFYNIYWPDNGKQRRIWGATAAMMRQLVTQWQVHHAAA